MPQTTDELRARKCVPCEGGVPKLTPDQAAAQMQALDGWVLYDNSNWISKCWTAANFVAAMDFLNKVAEIAESEGHHPDVHLTGYRNVKIEISTHAIGGLSDNDFILAAKIDELPLES